MMNNVHAGKSNLLGATVKCLKIGAICVCFRIKRVQAFTIKWHNRQDNTRDISFTSIKQAKISTIWTDWPHASLHLPSQAWLPLAAFQLYYSRVLIAYFDDKLVTSALKCAVAV